MFRISNILDRYSGLNQFSDKFYKFNFSEYYFNIFNKSNLKKLLPFYRQMVISRSQYLSSSPETPSQILSQFLWYNNYIKIEDAVINFEKLSNKNINFLLQLFENGRFI